LRHAVLGDPSFDSFERRPGNPIVRGKPPFNWPVNGFLFEDPKSGNWNAYIGRYLTGYDIRPDLPRTHCRVHRSKDGGVSWEELGPSSSRRKPWKHFNLKAELALRGGAARVIWGYRAPLSADRHSADSTIHPLS
jgi:hypothetical protein